MNEVFMYDKKFVSQIIKNTRKAKGCTQAKVADAIGMSEKNYVNVENGKQYPQLDSFFRIIDFLEIPIENFGVHYNGILSKNKQELLKFILSSTDDECDLYLRLLNVLKN